MAYHEDLVRRIFCASSDIAFRMDDDTFWDHVYRQEGVDHDFDQPEYDPDHEAIDDFLGGGKCEVCGAVGACSWDELGLPMIHPKPFDLSDFDPTRHGY